MTHLRSPIRCLRGGDSAAILQLIKQLPAGCDGCGEALLYEVRGHSELDVDAVAVVVADDSLMALRLNQT